MKTPSLFISRNTTRRVRLRAPLQKGGRNTTVGGFFRLGSLFLISHVVTGPPKLFSRKIPVLESPRRRSPPQWNWTSFAWASVRVPEPGGTVDPTSNCEKTRVRRLEGQYHRVRKPVFPLVPSHTKVRSSIIVILW